MHDEAERRELQRAIRKAVHSLPERQRNPIWLHYFEGFSIAEISRLENASESSLRSRVQAGLKRLNRVLKEFDLDDESVLMPREAVSEPIAEGVGQ